jgi:hypothetical protein
MPSKRVYIKCARAFIHGQIHSDEALEQLNLSRKSIGSYFANKHSSRKGTGLNEDELKLLLPHLLNLSAESMDFRKEVDKYYTEINTNIPYKEGIEVEIGLVLDNAKPVTWYEEHPDPFDATKQIKVYNMPENLEDYVKYRHAKGHPHCAGSPKLAKGNPTIFYYIEDPDVTVQDAVDDSDMADKASALYQQLKDDDRKMKAILTLLQHFVAKKPGEIFVPEILKPEERKLRVRELATGKWYRQFYKTATDPEVFNKYLLVEMIRLNILKRYGTSIGVAESNEILGGSEEEAVANLFHSTANAQLLQTLKAQAKEKMDKQITR